MKVSGIYQIRNIVDNKIYVGSAIDIDKRWRQHKSNLKLTKHHSIHLQRAWILYGEEHFSFEIIEYVSDKDILLIREQYWIDKTQSYVANYGYNINQKAHSRIGVKATQETKDKLSLSHIGQKAWNKGIKTGKMKPESIAKMNGRIPWNKGKKGVMPTPWNKGTKGLYKHTDEWKKESSLRSTGRKHSEEAKRKMSINMQGNNKGVRRKR